MRADPGPDCDIMTANLDCQNLLRAAAVDLRVAELCLY